MWVLEPADLRRGFQKNVKGCEPADLRRGLQENAKGCVLPWRQGGSLKCFEGESSSQASDEGKDEGRARELQWTLEVQRPPSGTHKSLESHHGLAEYREWE